MSMSVSDRSNPSSLLPPSPASGQGGVQGSEKLESAETQAQSGGSRTGLMGRDAYTPADRRPDAASAGDEVLARGLGLREARRSRSAPRNGATDLAPAQGVDAGRAPAEGEPISVGGRSIPRLAAPFHRMSSVQQTALNAQSKLSNQLPPGMGFEDWRSEETALQAAAAAPVLGSDGKPVSLGELAIFKVGAFNSLPSAAQIFRISRHAGKTVLAFQDDSGRPKDALRPLTEVDGVPVPPDLRGKIFGIGSPDDRVVLDHRQASDVFVQQFAAMHQAKELLGVDALSAKATVIGHSMGAQDAPLTRSRLIEAGFPDAIGRVVGVAGSWTGNVTPGQRVMMDTTMATLKMYGPLTEDMVRMTDTMSNPTIMRQDFQGKGKLVDLSVYSTLGPPPTLEPRFGFPPFEVTGHNNIKPMFRAMVGQVEMLETMVTRPPWEWTPWESMKAFEQGSQESDGIVPTAMSAGFARRDLKLEQPYDHMGIVEDPAVIDTILRRLDRG